MEAVQCLTHVCEQGFQAWGDRPGVGHFSHWRQSISSYLRIYVAAHYLKYVLLH